MAREADRVITCSQYMAGHVSRTFGVPPERITAIPNGIDPRELEPVEGADAVAQDALRARFAGPDDRLVLMVGRLVYEKGFHLALDALAPVVRARRNVRFVVAGTGDAEAQLKRQARRLGSVALRLVPRLGRGRHAARALPRGRPLHRSVDLRAVRARRARGDGLRLPRRRRRHGRPARGRAGRRHGGVRFPSRDADACARSSSGSWSTTTPARGCVAEARSTCSGSTGRRWRGARSASTGR